MTQGTITAGSLLRTIAYPYDLRKLDTSQLEQVCKELRQYIIDIVSVYGGHFAANLGVVELTVALHYILNTPKDKLIWDVGHQAYGHKILTGRRKNFYTNRTLNGLSGFPKISESDYDAFGVGHSSTSISAALGMAIASNLLGEKNRHHVAVIGDGALTAGIAYEALNHAGTTNSDILVILNDNNISIDPNSGILQKVVSHSGNLFESLGFKYYGPIDGHNVNEIVDKLKEILKVPGPKLLHVKTIKGKGFETAEKNQTIWHAPGLFDKATGIINKKVYNTPQPPKYQDVFGKTIIELARENPKIMGITPAMPSGCSLKYMMEEMPDRALDVGIAEQHAVTLSAGLATKGMKVFCNIYSTFMQRAYDMVIHDVAIQNLPVIFCLDRAGLVGEDGATHHGAYDIAFMRCIPNMIVSAPMNESELRNLMYTAQLETTKNPFVIRYPRGKGVLTNWETPMEEISIGKARKIKDGQEIAILTIGHVGNFAVEACKELETFGISPAHYDMRFVKPLDEELLHEIGQKFSKIITVEDACIKGGMGSAILEFLNENNYHLVVKILGIPDSVIGQGSTEELQHLCHFDTEAIVINTKELMNRGDLN
ncbi:MAG TPA: 1-deoxy-D-xylulose-5-phosphate synthase [Edaphocola sp.]|nr:1-deoxy-D-xylulose-5-phosphate synthase [Edaphocola sp.]